MASKLLNDEQFATLKNYCKIDQNFDDDVLWGLIDSASWEITRAINDKKKPDDYISDSRFFVLIMKYVEEDYYYRGTGSEVMRFPLQNKSTDNIINQLRAEEFEGDEV